MRAFLVAAVILLGGARIGVEIWEMQHPEPVIPWHSEQRGTDCAHSLNPSHCFEEVAPAQIWVPADSTMKDESILIPDVEACKRWNAGQHEPSDTCPDGVVERVDY